MGNNNALIEALQKCATACENCADACLHEDNLSEMVACIRLDRDCANVCTTALYMTIRDSEYIRSILTLCEQICADCAEECEKHDHDHCQQCARACRRCEEQCREYLN